MSSRLLSRAVFAVQGTAGLVAGVLHERVESAVSQRAPSVCGGCDEGAAIEFSRLSLLFVSVLLPLFPLRNVRRRRWPGQYYDVIAYHTRLGSARNGMETKSHACAIKESSKNEIVMSELATIMSLSRQSPKSPASLSVSQSSAIVVGNSSLVLLLELPLSDHPSLPSPSPPPPTSPCPPLSPLSPFHTLQEYQSSCKLY